MVANVCCQCATNIIYREETKLIAPSIRILYNLSNYCNFEFAFRNSQGTTDGIMINVNLHNFNVIDPLLEKFCQSVIVKQKSDG